MTINIQIAKHIREVFFGGNWTDVHLKNTLEDINREEATSRIYNLNTIATLVFHINYFVSPVLKVLQGQPLTGNDKLSFDLPPITSENEWQELKSKIFNEAEVLASEIEKLDEARLFEVFADIKYGNYYRNLHGLIEHTHYHLGQIALIKKIIRHMKVKDTV